MISARGPLAVHVHAIELVADLPVRARGRAGGKACPGSITMHLVFSDQLAISLTLRTERILAWKGCDDFQPVPGTLGAASSDCRRGTGLRSADRVASWSRKRAIAETGAPLRIDCHPVSC